MYLLQLFAGIFIGSVISLLVFIVIPLKLKQIRLKKEIKNNKDTKDTYFKSYFSFIFEYRKISYYCFFKMGANSEVYRMETFADPKFIGKTTVCPLYDFHIRLYSITGKENFIEKFLIPLIDNFEETEKINEKISEIKKEFI